VAIASVSGETCGAVAGELEAVGGSARRVDVAAVSAGETRVLLRENACPSETWRQTRRSKNVYLYLFKDK